MSASQVLNARTY